MQNSANPGEMKVVASGVGKLSVVTALRASLNACKEDVVSFGSPGQRAGLGHGAEWLKDEYRAWNKAVVLVDHS